MHMCVALVVTTRQFLRTKLHQVLIGCDTGEHDNQSKELEPTPIMVFIAFTYLMYFAQKLERDEYPLHSKESMLSKSPPYRVGVFFVS